MACVIYLILLLQFGIEASCYATSTGSRSILRELNEPDLHDAAVDLNSTNFDSVLRRSPASYAVVEFFASWCPACRNYKPQYEKVAKLFNGPDAAHPGIILMTRVDCAEKINTKLCDRFSVSHYPMLFWAPPSKFLSGGWEPNQKKNEIRPIDDFRKADSLLNWINKQLGSSYRLDDEKFVNDHLALNESDPGQIVRAVYDVEEATSTAFDIILTHKMIISKTRAPLISFLQLLVAHHPSKRCRKGSADILVNFDDSWPSDLWSVSAQNTIVTPERNAINGFQICGKEVPRGYWIFCRGSRNETRGFSCGLWVLLHSLSVRIEDGESQLVFTSMCDFIHTFFICEECRQHFYEMCSSVSAPFTKTSDLALWLWSAHNEVNKRLMKEEAHQKTGDPKYPKMIWPPKQLCPSCYISTSQTNNGTYDWNKNEVFKFLVDYYGKMLVSSYKDKGYLADEVSEPTDDTTTSTNVVAVPLGAALGIALASCAFGALACYWRSQQKNRKTRRNWS